MHVDNTIMINVNVRFGGLKLKNICCGQWVHSNVEVHDIDNMTINQMEWRGRVGLEGMILKNILQWAVGTLSKVEVHDTDNMLVP